MSGLARKMKREQLREQYRKFQRAWDDEKLFQQYLISSQKAQIVDEGEPWKSDRPRESRLVLVDSDGNKSQILGKKPTFNAWMKMVENHKRAATATSQDTKKVAVEDLSWDEGG